MTWPKGAEVIESLLDRGHLERVVANPEEATYLLEKARVHLATAERLCDLDPEIAYDALYGAARKALTAILRQQGLRPTREGGHEAVIEAAEAQLVPPAGPILKPYRRLRRTTSSARESAPLSSSRSSSTPATTSRRPSGCSRPEERSGR